MIIVYRQMYSPFDVDVRVISCIYFLDITDERIAAEKLNGSSARR